MEDTISLGTKIRTLRALRGWSQQKLASQIGIARINVSMYETGDQTPKASTLKNIQAAFNLDFAAPQVEAAFSILANDDARAAQVRLALAILEGHPTPEPSNGRN